MAAFLCFLALKTLSRKLTARTLFIRLQGERLTFNLFSLSHWRDLLGKTI